MNIARTRSVHSNQPPLPFKIAGLQASKVSEILPRGIQSLAACRRQVSSSAGKTSPCKKDCRPKRAIFACPWFVPGRLRRELLFRTPGRSQGLRSTRPYLSLRPVFCCQNAQPCSLPPQYNFPSTSGRFAAESLTMLQRGLPVSQAFPRVAKQDQTGFCALRSAIFFAKHCKTIVYQ
ncbi:hypothetical protein BD311DRAFT_197409 [Dichomitus squalens]|uniref:Uncharacterized protein n=1 Tax=Dichomitus squalens TaxID=114155 RepID=A0A4Q9N334_9APHY|nr:hypothetical protein BD311DRAFT_197409 [Dichomitus squalens]